MLGMKKLSPLIMFLKVISSLLWIIDRLKPDLSYEKYIENYGSIDRILASWESLYGAKVVLIG